MSLVLMTLAQAWINAHLGSQGVTCVQCGGIFGGDPAYAACFVGSARGDDVARTCRKERPVS